MKSECKLHFKCFPLDQVHRTINLEVACSQHIGKTILESNNSNSVKLHRTNGSRDNYVWDGGPEYCHQGSSWDSHCWILGGGRGILPALCKDTHMNIGSQSQATRNCTYLKVSWNVSSRQDSGGRWKENWKHAKEASVFAPPVGYKIGGKNISWCKKKLNCQSEGFIYWIYTYWITLRWKLNDVYVPTTDVTFVAEKSLCLFLCWRRNDCSNNVTCKWHHDNQEKQDLRLRNDTEMRYKAIPLFKCDGLVCYIQIWKTVILVWLRSAKASGADLC